MTRDKRIAWLRQWRTEERMYRDYADTSSELACRNAQIEELEKAIWRERALRLIEKLRAREQRQRERAEKAERCCHLLSMHALTKFKLGTADLSQEEWGWLSEILKRRRTG